MQIKVDELKLEIRCSGGSLEALLHAKIRKKILKLWQTRNITYTQVKTIEKMCESKSQALLFTKDETFGELSKIIVSYIDENSIKFIDSTDNQNDAMGYSMGKKVIINDPTKMIVDDHRNYLIRRLKGEL